MPFKTWKVWREALKEFYNCLILRNDYGNNVNPHKAQRFRCYSHIVTMMWYIEIKIRKVQENFTTFLKKNTLYMHGIVNRQLMYVCKEGTNKVTVYNDHTQPNQMWPPEVLNFPKGFSIMYIQNLPDHFWESCKVMEWLHDFKLSNCITNIYLLLLRALGLGPEQIS